MISLFTKKPQGRVFIGRIGKDRDDCVNVRIDRATPFGNLAKLNGEHSRDACCDWYEEYFKEQVFSGTGDLCYAFLELIEILDTGKDINLQCWCTPKRCHGETIKNFIFRYLKERK